MVLSIRRSTSRDFGETVKLLRVTERITKLMVRRLNKIYKLARKAGRTYGRASEPIAEMSARIKPPSSHTIVRREQGIVKRALDHAERSLTFIKQALKSARDGDASRAVGIITHIKSHSMTSLIHDGYMLYEELKREMDAIDEYVSYLTREKEQMEHARNQETRMNKIEEKERKRGKLIKKFGRATVSKAGNWQRETKYMVVITNFERKISDWEKIREYVEDMFNITKKIIRQDNRLVKLFDEVGE